MAGNKLCVNLLRYAEQVYHNLLPVIWRLYFNKLTKLNIQFLNTCIPTLKISTWQSFPHFGYRWLLKWISRIWAFSIGVANCKSESYGEVSQDNILYQSYDDHSLEINKTRFKIVLDWKVLPNSNRLRINRFKFTPWHIIALIGQILNRFIWGFSWLLLLMTRFSPLNMLRINRRGQPWYWLRLLYM